MKCVLEFARRVHFRCIFAVLSREVADRVRRGYIYILPRDTHDSLALRRRRRPPGWVIIVLKMASPQSRHAQDAPVQDDEVAAFRRAPDDWHRMKQEHQVELMRDCNNACQGLVELIYKDVLEVPKSLPTIVGASRSTVIQVKDK